MGDGSLTQEEIDLLLQGADDFAGAAPEGQAGQAGAAAGRDLSPLERESVADMMLQALQSGVQGLGMILSRNVRLGTPYAEMRSQDDIRKEFGQNYVIFSQTLSGAMSGTMAMFIPAADAVRLSGIVMGNEDMSGAAPDSAQLASVKDAIGPMLYSVATQLSVKLGSPLTPGPVDVRTLAGANFPLNDAPSYLRIQFPFNVEGGVDSRLTLVVPQALATELARAGQRGGGMGSQGAPGTQAAIGPLPGQTGVKEVAFPQLSMSGSGPVHPNMNLLMDVQMSLTVELGRTKMYIKEILGLGEGSIIELDKLAGEPVDLLVNGKLIAKGEVVVIDENFGVRVTDIVSPIDRLKVQK